MKLPLVLALSFNPFRVAAFLKGRQYSSCVEDDCSRATNFTNKGYGRDGTADCRAYMTSTLVVSPVRRTLTSTSVSTLTIVPPCPVFPTQKNPAGIYARQPQAAGHLDHAPPGYKYAPPAGRDTSAPSIAIKSWSVPEYALSVCRPDKYSSACRCLGVTPGQITMTGFTLEATITVTKTESKLAPCSTPASTSIISFSYSGITSTTTIAVYNPIGSGTGTGSGSHYYPTISIPSTSSTRGHTYSYIPLPPPPYGTTSSPPPSYIPPTPPYTNRTTSGYGGIPTSNTTAPPSNSTLPPTTIPSTNPTLPPTSSFSNSTIPPTTLPPANSTLPPSNSTTPPTMIPTSNSTLPPFPTWNSTLPPPDPTAPPTPIPPANSTLPPFPTGNSTLPPFPTANSTLPPFPTGNSTLPPFPTGNSTLPPFPTANSTLPPFPTGNSTLPPFPTANSTLPPFPTANSTLPPFPTGNSTLPPNPTSPPTNTSLPLTNTTTSPPTSTPTCGGRGVLLCNGTCTDTTTSTSHCGACNNPCQPGYLCSNGVCTRPPCDSDCRFSRLCNTDSGGNSTSTVCACGQTAEGAGVCYNRGVVQCQTNVPPLCERSSQCAVGTVCVRSVCCGTRLGRCVSPKGCGIQGAGMELGERISFAFGGFESDGEGEGEEGGSSVLF
ncbi:unnamed protein product [Periconia digitata]|uniref:Uncharacterized protein n=1 Tax=Periconia digitata TaxID=1303443 RepID=A0A9W4U6K2_9PLEO|nr:unnamed protein product [Periconia digitata]